MSSSIGQPLLEGELNKLLLRAYDFLCKRNTFEAIRLAAQIAQVEPEHPDLPYLLGMSFFLDGRFGEAVESLRSAVLKKPDDPERRRNLALALQKIGMVDEAEAELRKALETTPKYFQGLNDLGLILYRRGSYEEAAEAYRRSVEIHPENGYAWNNLALVLKEQARISEALAAFRRALDCGALEDVRSNYLFTLNCTADLSEEKIQAEHVALCQSGSDPSFHPPKNRAGKTVLDIAYLSADLRVHPVSQFIKALLDHHDRNRFRITCYSNAEHEDKLTLALRKSVERWHSIRSLDDQTVADQIRSDGIDILIDLSGHTAGNRLGVLEKRPAALIVNYLGYPNINGSKAVDWRIVDRRTDPPTRQGREMDRERLLRLPGCFLCYTPPSDDLVPNCDNAYGPVQLASFNNIAKLDDLTVALWAAMLNRTHPARLLLKYGSLIDDRTIARIRQRFLAAGLKDPESLSFKGCDPDYLDHLASYNQVDLALDPVLYNGTTTTCEALFMGVPVVTIAGKVHRSRVGSSILHAIEASEWIATDESDYIEKVVELVRVGRRSTEERRQLRHRVATSQLCDSVRFTRKFERLLLRLAGQNG